MCLAALRTGVLAFPHPTPSRRCSTTTISTDRCRGMRVLALALAAERELIAARTAGLDAVDLLGAQDVGDADGPGGSRRTGPATGGPGAAGWRMAAVYLRLAGESAPQLLEGAIRTYAWGSRTAIPWSVHRGWCRRAPGSRDVVRRPPG